MNTDERIHAYCRNPDTVNDINIDISLEDKQMQRPETSQLIMDSNILFQYDVDKLIELDFISSLS
jgi:hypothetical protein